MKWSTLASVMLLCLASIANAQNVPRVMRVSYGNIFDQDPAASSPAPTTTYHQHHANSGCCSDKVSSGCQGLWDGYCSDSCGPRCFGGFGILQRCRNAFSSCSMGGCGDCPTICGNRWSHVGGRGLGGCGANYGCGGCEIADSCCNLGCGIGHKCKHFVHRCRSFCHFDSCQTGCDGSTGCASCAGGSSEPSMPSTLDDAPQPPADNVPKDAYRSPSHPTRAPMIHSKPVSDRSVRLPKTRSVSF